MGKRDRMEWRIELLGGLQASCGDERITQFRSRKTAILLAYLAFFRGLHPRDRLIELLWPESPLESGRNSLRVALADLRRRSMAPSSTNPQLWPSLLEQDRVSVGLSVGAKTDVEEFESVVEEAQRALTWQVRIEYYERARGLYRGGLLPGFYEDWIPVQEVRLETTFLYVLKTLRDYYQRSGDSARAFELAQLAARFGVQSRNSPRQTKPKRFRRPRTSKSLPHEQETHESEAPSVPETTCDFPLELQAPLPNVFTRFFGRESEIEELKSILWNRQTRLLTITGSGGMGKTRLALELARSLSAFSTPSFHRTFWIPLADVSEAERLPETLVRVLNLSLSKAQSQEDQHDLIEGIARFLDDEHEDRGDTLLLLDNFEQLLPEGSAFLGELLQRVPYLVILVTSRQKLSLPEEREHRLRSLSLPFTSSQSDEALISEPQLANLYESSSVQLFADRARSARSDWRLLPDEVSSLSALLHRLQGLPLAIELVAARAGVLSTTQMLSRLWQSLQWVSSRDPHRPLRHRSLHAVVEWSLQLLSPTEREIFARLSVFHGGWTLEDANAVLSDVEAIHLLQALQSLHDASLIISTEIEGADLRFSMLEIVRQLAAERLGAQEQLTTQRQHAEFYFRLADTASRSAGGIRGRQIWAATEGPNFIAAFVFWASQNLGRTLEMAAALWWYWIFDYHLPEARHYLSELLANPQVDDFPVSRARVQGCAAYVELLSGNLTETEILLRGALSTWQSIGNQNEIAGTYNLLGALANTRGERERAREFYAQSLVLRRIANQPRELAIAMNALAGIERDCGHPDVARQLCEEALDVARRHDDQAGEAWASHTLGWLAFDAGDLVSARDYQEKSLAYRRFAKHYHAEAGCLEALGQVAQKEGDLEAARAYYQQALKLWRRINQPLRIQATQRLLEDIEEASA